MLLSCGNELLHPSKSRCAVNEWSRQPACLLTVSNLLISPAIHSPTSHVHLNSLFKTLFPQSICYVFTEIWHIVERVGAKVPWQYFSCWTAIFRSLSCFPFHGCSGNKGFSFWLKIEEAKSWRVSGRELFSEEDQSIVETYVAVDLDLHWRRDAR